MPACTAPAAAPLAAGAPLWHCGKRGVAAGQSWGHACSRLGCHRAWRRRRLRAAQQQGHRGSCAVRTLYCASSMAAEQPLEKHISPSDEAQQGKGVAGKGKPRKLSDGNVQGRAELQARQHPPPALLACRCSIHPLYVPNALTMSSRMQKKMSQPRPAPCGTIDRRMMSTSMDAGVK